MEGPERFLRDLGIELACAVDPEAAARLDADHRAFLNYEAYYFSTDEAKAHFLAQPHAYSGPVTDPVSLERFEPGENSPIRRYARRFFYFAREETAKQFDAAPEGYLRPKITMREMKPLAWGQVSQ